MDGRVTNRAGVKRLFVAAYLLALAFIVLIQSPLRFWDSGLAGTDSSVFQTVAMMMKKGFMPYRDSFDHKGPLIYLIDYAGLSLSPRWGVWLVELASAFITLAAMYRTARLRCGRTGACLAVAAAAAPLLNYNHNFFDGGNLVEEYAMPFIAAAVYIFLDYLSSGRVTRLRLAVCGLCLGGVCLLRVNMIAVWIVFCLAIAGRCAAQKDFAQLGTFILFFLAGFGVIVLPILIWLAANGALLPFWRDYILFNMVYAAGHEGGATAASVLTTVQFYTNKTIVFFTLAYTAYAAFTARGKERFLHWSYLAAVVLSLLLLSLSRYTFPHYGMVLVPLFAFPTASLYRHCAREIAAGGGRTAFKAAAGILSAATVLLYAFVADVNLNTDVSNSSRDAVADVCALIEEHTGPDDSISVFGNWDIIYLASGRPHATSYSYQSPIGSVAPEIMDDYYAQLAEEEPKLIVLTQVYSQYDTVGPFLEAHGYTVVWMEAGGYVDGAAVYVRG